MRIISCNIRFSFMQEKKAEHTWKYRSNLCAEAILQSQPDIICLQECHNDQFHELYSAFGQNEWSVFWINTYAREEFPENAIFYKAKMFEVINHGGYHLSDTPHIPGSRIDGSECVRFVNFLVLRDSHGVFRIINTHLDHASQDAREKQAKMIISEAKAWNDMPQILTGDFNCDVENNVMKSFFESGWHDSYASANNIREPGFTFHGFEGESWNGDLGVCGNGKMDFILYYGNIISQRSCIIKDHQGDIYPSDHYFVTTDFCR